MTPATGLTITNGGRPTMTRSAWFSAILSAALLAALDGCGSSNSSINKDGGGTGGAAGMTGDASAGTGGKVGTGGTTGTGGASATGGASGTGGANGSGGTTGTDSGTLTCQAGASCSGAQTCSTTTGCRPGTQNVCFCDPNGQLACQGCEMSDAGSDASNDAGGGTGCPTNANGTSCTTSMAFCQHTCANNSMEVCRCRAATGGSDAGMAWQCFNACQ
jgi:hypothetical protein